MINKTDLKSTFLRNMKISNFFPFYVFIFLGVTCAIWRDLWINESAKTLTAFSLYISIIALLISNYFIVENAIESRAKTKKKLFSEYCARFSSNQNINKVAEWLFIISEFDSNGTINVYPKRLMDNKGRTITEPTYYEKRCFYDFLIELNIQIKYKQLEKEDVKKYFSPYILIFYKVLEGENSNCNMWNLSDISEIL